MRTYKDFYSKEARLKTFNDWQWGNKNELAESGFIFYGYEDEISCHWCGTTVSYTQEMSVDAIHLKRNKNCKFLKKKFKNDTFICCKGVKRQKFQNDNSPTSSSSEDDINISEDIADKIAENTLKKHDDQQHKKLKKRQQQQQQRKSKRLQQLTRRRKKRKL